MLTWSWGLRTFLRSPFEHAAGEVPDHSLFAQSFPVAVLKHLWVFTPWHTREGLSLLLPFCDLQALCCFDGLSSMFPHVEHPTIRPLSTPTGLDMDIHLLPDHHAPALTAHSTDHLGITRH